MEIKKKLIYSLIILSILITIFLFNSTYQIKINIVLNNISCLEIDSKISENIKNELLKINGIKEIYIFSKNEYCNIYIKLNRNFNNSLALIKIKIDSVLQNSQLTYKINFDEKYNIKYQYYILISSNILNYSTLTQYEDIIYRELINKRYIKKITKFNSDNDVIYIYFKNQNLIDYNISITELKNIIKKNLIDINLSKLENNNFIYTKSNSNLNSINDIKNISIYYKNSNLSNKLGNIFNIEEKEKSQPDFFVNYNNEETKVIALNICPISKFLFKRNFENILNKNTFSSFAKIKLIDTNKLSKDVIYLENPTSNNKMKKIIEKKNIKDGIVFYKKDNPKIKNSDKFEEIDNNKIIILYEKRKNKDYKNNKFYRIIQFDSIDLLDIENFLKQQNKKINLATKKENVIYHKIDNANINDYFITKEEIQDSILANENGLIAGYIFKNSIKIPIIIKNCDTNKNLIYSSKYKKLLDTNVILEDKIIKEYTTIIRKNGKFIAKLKN